MLAKDKCYEEHRRKEWGSERVGIEWWAPYFSKSDQRKPL